MLIAAAKAQDQVLAIPAPTVLFAEFADWALKFNLICFVDDIELGERTRSDINFDILRRMREAELAHPLPGAPPPPDPAAKLNSAPPQAAAVRPASQPMIACLRARPQW